MLPFVLLLAAAAPHAKARAPVPVPFRRLETPSCVASEGPLPVVPAGAGPRVFTSAAAFRKAFGCAPPADVDFRRERLVVATYSYASPSTSGALASAPIVGRKVVLTYAQTHVCQGIAQETLSHVDVVALPESKLPVEVTVADSGPECGAVP